MKEEQKEKTIQIVPWGRCIVALSNNGRMSKLMPMENANNKFEWRLLEPINYNKLK